MEIPRLNGIIKQLEQGKNTFVSFVPADVGNTVAAATEPYDGVIFEMEHNGYDISALRNCLQYLLNRRQIVESKSLAPATVGWLYWRGNPRFCERSPSPITTTPIPGTSFRIFGRFFMPTTSSHMMPTRISPLGSSGHTSARS